MSDLQGSGEIIANSPLIRVFEHEYEFRGDSRPLRAMFGHTGVQGEVGVYQFDPTTNTTLDLIRKIDRAVPGYILDPVDAEEPDDKRRVMSFLLTDDPEEVHAASCSPEDMYMEFNTKLFKDSPELFWSVFLHEYAHYRFGQLPSDVQRQLSDLLLKNETSTKAFVALVEELFTDKLMLKSGKTAGAYYQEAYSANGINSQYLLSPQDSELPGFKDHRTIEMELDGERGQFVLGILTSEVLSYMSSLFVGSDSYEIAKAAAAKYRDVEEDPRHILIKRFYDLLTDEERHFIAETCQIYPRKVLSEKRSILAKIGNHIAYLEQVLDSREDDGKA